MEERTIKRCGFCSMLSGLLRRAMCVGSRRGSSESYYRELGDQDTLRIDSQRTEVPDSEENSQKLSRPELSAEGEQILYDLNKMKYETVADSRFLTIHKRRRKPLLTRSLQKNKALLDDISLGQVQCLLNQSVHWTFNAFSLDVASGGRCLPVLCVHLFHMYGLMSHFKLDPAKAWKLFSLIEEGYQSSNPYHNSIHAADVTQAMHCFLQQDRILKNLEPLEILASLIAAIAHDMDHPGVSQTFLYATSNHIAHLYDNTSVLENHHWRSAVSCLAESGLLDHMGEFREEIEKKISTLILATDITKQQEYLTKFRGHLDENTMDMTDPEHRHLVLQMALKCADISNPCRPWEISRRWSLKVCEEFYRQGEFERKLNIPLTSLCDRRAMSIPKIQTGFFKFIVTPLISEWDRFLHNDLTAQMRHNLCYNERKWEALLAQELADDIMCTELPEVPLIDDDLDISPQANISDSSELLLPPRRGSLSPSKGALKDQLRRLSVPLHVFQDSKFKSRADKNRCIAVVQVERVDDASGEHSALSQLSVGTDEKVLSMEKLITEPSRASISTPEEVTRLSTVVRDSGNWKLVRQQTFPPLETARDHSLVTRSLHTSNEGAISHFKTDSPKFDLASYLKEGRIGNLFSRLDTVKTDCIADSTYANVESAELPRTIYKEIERKRRESIAVGSQLRDNLTSVQLGLDSIHLLHRRKSMPTDVVSFAPKEKKVREISAAQFLLRTVSGKECWTRRRGSAPSPIASSELRGLASMSSLRHSVNGGRRKPNPILTCQQWLAKATHSVQDRKFQNLPRRSSLPVEVMTGISSY